MKFLKQFLSELTQTGGRVWDFDLNQTRGKHSSFLNFPFAKVVLLAAEVAAPRRGVVFVIPPLHLSTFFPLSFYPFYFFLLSPIPSSSSPPPSITSSGLRFGGRIRIKRTDCRKLVVESPTGSHFPSTPRSSSFPACVFSFYPFFPSRLSWFYSRPLPPSRPSSRHATATKRGRRPRDRNQKILKGLWRREAPFDHRFAAAREIAVFFAPDGKWPRFCPSVSSCRLLLARISIVCCHSSRTIISSINF